MFDASAVCPTCTSFEPVFREWNGIYHCHYCGDEFKRISNDSYERLTVTPPIPTHMVVVNGKIEERELWLIVNDKERTWDYPQLVTNDEDFTASRRNNAIREYAEACALYVKARPWKGDTT